MVYERLKHSGDLPIIGVNAFRQPGSEHESVSGTVELARATEEEKQSQLSRLRDFQRRHEKGAAAELERLQQVALAGENIFTELMNAVRQCSLGQITQALFEVGGKYRRNM